MSANNSTKTILKKIEHDLQSCGIEDASLEASLLLETFCGFDRLEQLRYPERELEVAQINHLEAAVQERCKRKPLSLILGETCFYGRFFYVTEDIITPRPDTEILVEAVVTKIRERYSRPSEGIAVLDSCTGSGCIGISVWLESGKAVRKLDLIDTSAKALQLARRNAERHGLPETGISFLNCDLWPDSNTRYDVITCNPPYISKEDMSQLMPEVALYEPEIALYGGLDGLDFYRRLAAEAANYLFPGGLLALEHAHDQRKKIKQIFSDSPFVLLSELDDYGRNARVLIYELAE